MGLLGLPFFFTKGDLGGQARNVPKKFLLIALIGFFYALTFPSVGFAETTPSAELEGLLQKIEARHYRWIAIRADVLLFFAKAGDPNAMCGGELLYQRLDERMLLTCVDTRQQLMFVFRTFDRRFDLYLPSQNTVYHGSIFDMEDSPDIESHLKARDLYRALKPLAVDPRRTKIERSNSAMTSLDVYGRNGDKEKLVRKLYLTPDGDVRGELFYNPSERPVTEIQRYDFRELKGRVGAYDSIFFPKKITISSPETKKGSAIFFTHITALDTIDPLDFILRILPGTKEVFLDEKDPRFQSSGTAEGEIRLSPKAAQVARPQPEPEGRSVKTQIAVALPVEKEEKKVPAASKEKLAKKAAREPSPEKKASPTMEEVRDTTVKTPLAPVPHGDADADRVIEDTPPHTSDAQTTLDPSVDPAA